jgi:hypothetical protein
MADGGLATMPSALHLVAELVPETDDFQAENERLQEELQLEWEGREKTVVVVASSSKPMIEENNFSKRRTMIYCGIVAFVVIRVVVGVAVGVTGAPTPLPATSPPIVSPTDKPSKSPTMRPTIQNEKVAISGNVNPFVDEPGRFCSFGQDDLISIIGESCMRTGDGGPMTLDAGIYDAAGCIYCARNVLERRGESSFGTSAVTKCFKGVGIQLSLQLQTTGFPEML